MLPNIFWCQSSLVAQHSVTLEIAPLFNRKKLRLDTPKEFDLNGETIVLDAFRFYLSGITLLRKGDAIWEEANSYHLIDAADPNSLQIELPSEDPILYDAIRFQLGIDSVTNVSGVFGGDLDPTKSMYWAWQSGYINFKLEGSSPNSPARNNAFQFHLGGYAAPFANMQTITLFTDKLDMNLKDGKSKVKKGDSGSIGENGDTGKRDESFGKKCKRIVVQFDVGKYLSNYDLSQHYKVMSPSEEGTQMARVAARYFGIKW